MNISRIFGENLRILSEIKGNISAISRDLEINRVQYNRFLKGESFPKPATLNSICAYFGVDGRIYVEPLTDTQLEAAKAKAAGEVNWVQETLPDREMVGGLDSDVPKALVPDGLHLIWRPAFSNPDDAVMLLIQIKSDNSIRRCKGYEVAQSFQSHTGIHGCNGRMFSGIVAKASDGFSLIYSKQLPSFFLGTCYFDGTHNHGDDIFYGFATLHRGETPEKRRLSRAVFQLLPPNLEDILPYARQKGVLPMDRVPIRIADLLNRKLA